MGTQRVQMNGVLPLLIRWAHRAGTRYFILPWLLYSAQYKIFFPHCTLFQFMCRHCPATWEAVVQGRLSRNVCLRFFPIVKKHFSLTEMTTINIFTIRINKKWNLELCIVIIKHET
jgi:hypothetical protein